MANPAFHIRIFHLHCDPTSAANIAPIQTALANWKRAWLNRTAVKGLEECSSQDPNDAWRTIGFIGNVMEYWYLAVVVLGKCKSLHGLKIDGNSGTGGTLRKGFLEKYDESDMGQVHELVSDIREMHL